ncbi:Leucyl/phenylalanyl-tRNA--protein transferase [Frankliniella fusca]|uniref:Leucyl/phenylalanyl-tRNA--protein transferase n=1 Tax=Frankliniella fusca TaxID=407009 RepID=A0AAE1GRG0_9NEOP|nr:Leucyl/phenylalanyl-tRNA--protein transferase [Frankliniella fusca]
MKIKHKSDVEQSQNAQRGGSETSALLSGSHLRGAGLGYALFGESLVNAKIQNVQMKAAMMSCGDCQVKDETDENDPGQSDPPSHSQVIPSISGSISQAVLVHDDL